MDFVHDALLDGRPFRVLTIVDQWSCWSPFLKVAEGMSGKAVAQALDRAIALHGKPRSITVDHGTEITTISRLSSKTYRIVSFAIANVSCYSGEVSTKPTPLVES